MLLDELMPAYDVVERHTRAITAPPERVYAAIRATDFGASPVIRALFLLRSLGTHRAMTWDALGRAGFVVVADKPPRELVLGLVARPWRLDGGIAHVTADQWRAFDRSPGGFAKIAWSFEVGARELATETRVRCTDAASARKFRRYWRVIGPFSGWIRREMLRLVEREATASRPAAA
jgi:hypothetical protein